MNSLSEIEAAILQLPNDKIRQLSAWLQDYLADSWDKQIETDAKLGKFDRLLEQVNLDIASNNTKPLDEIFDNS